MHFILSRDTAREQERATVGAGGILIMARKFPYGVGGPYSLQDICQTTILINTGLRFEQGRRCSSARESLSFGWAKPRPETACELNHKSEPMGRINR